MLRVVHRGNIDNKSSWFQGRADFVQHGQLALLKEAFPNFFAKMPVDLHLTGGAGRNSIYLLIPRLKSYSSWCEVKRQFGFDHVLCFVLFAALTCEHAMFAHPNPDTWPAPTAPSTDKASYSAAAAALDELAPKLKSPSMLALIAALRSMDDQQIKCVFDSNRAKLLPSNGEGKSPANLFGCCQS